MHFINNYIRFFKKIKICTRFLISDFLSDFFIFEIIFYARFLILINYMRFLAYNYARFLEKNRKIGIFFLAARFKSISLILGLMI